MQLQRAYTDGKMWFVSFRQIHQGVPVEWAEVGYSINPHGEVITLGGRSYQNVEVVTNPTLSFAAAISAAREVFNEDLAEVRDNAELIILPVGTEEVRFYLTWKVGLFSLRPLRYVSYYVDAHSGKVVRTSNNVREAHAHAADTTSTVREDRKHSPLVTLQGQITGVYFPTDHNDNTMNASFSTRNIKVFDVGGRFINSFGSSPN